MKEQQPDSFFREKLQDFERAAPPRAWERIESKLEKKTNFFGLWFKMAASLLLLVTIAYVLLPDGNRPEDQPLAKSNSQQSLSQAEAVQPLEPAVKKQELKAVDSAGYRKVSTPEKTVSQKSKQSIVLSQEKVKQDTPATQANTDVVEPARDNETPSSPINNAVAMVQNETITLKFSAEETNKYLNKNTLAEATSEEKKPSTLKKILKKANDLKSNQDPFGGLREKKNEILALNFKNDKRGQNK